MLLFAEAIPDSWYAVAVSIAVSAIAAASAGWQIFVNHLDKKSERETKAEAVERRLKDCEDDRADLRRRIEHLEKLLAVPPSGKQLVGVHGSLMDKLEGGS